MEFLVDLVNSRGMIHDCVTVRPSCHLVNVNIYIYMYVYIYMYIYMYYIYICIIYIYVLYIYVYIIVHMCTINMFFAMTMIINAQIFCDIWQHIMTRT